MEETLGKRIMRHRKTLGLTQDQLAEQLGVTAQAVSKWENDLSCPDIAMLPRLSAIFGITTDQLLGSAPEEAAQPPVFEAEVVEETEPEGIHIEKDGWEFHWDNGRTDALRLAVLVLLVGAQLLAVKLLHRDINFWQILWPTALAVFGVFGLVHRFSFIKMCSLLLGGWFLLDYWQLIPLELDGTLVFPVLVIIFGLSLLMDALKKPKKAKFRFNNKSNKQRNDFKADGETFTYSASFGESCQRIEMPRLRHGDISCSFGDYEVDLGGVEEVCDGCILETSCSFGELRLLVPRRYAIRQNNSTAFAAFDISGHPDSNPQGVIQLKASVSFGQIAVKYI